MIRRAFLVRAGAAVAGTAVWGIQTSGQASFGGVVTLHRDGSGPGTPVPAMFLGFGYEMSSAAPLGLMSPGNTRYVHLLRNLGPAGVLRFGGIVADFTSYDPAGTVVAEPKHTVITRASLTQLRAFLDLVGWRAIWSVNFGRGTLDQAIAEARDVAAILGDRLLALELGNEVENYGRGAAPLRTPTYDFETYRAEYARWHDATLSAVPGISFAAPDTAASVEWVEQMAADAKGTVQLLTTHYYRDGRQHGTAGQLASPDPGMEDRLRRLRAASERNGIPWRMCETNSFYGGGLPGVSDTLLGALWTLDFMLLLATWRCSGVNIETGVNQLGFISSYSPIRDDGKGRNYAGAPYYGMLACAQALRSGTEMLPLTIEGYAARESPGLTAYGIGRAGKMTAVVLVNRSTADRAIVAFGELGMSRVRAMRLAGKAGLSAEDITFAGASVREDGTWSAGAAEPVQGRELQVDPMSAVLLVAGTVR